MNKSIIRVRRHFLLPLSIFAALDLVLIVVLVTRLTATTQAREHRRDELRDQKHKLEEAYKPFQDVHTELDNARGQVKNFYADRMPEYYSQLSNELDKLSKQEGIQLAAVAYAPADASEHAQEGGSRVIGTPGAQGVRITTAISGDYIKLIKFINALERDQLFFIVERLSLVGQSGTGPNQGPGTVSLQLSLLTYMRKS